jgi:hypothetical protein
MLPVFVVEQRDALRQFGSGASAAIPTRRVSEGLLVKKRQLYR